MRYIITLLAIAAFAFAGIDATLDLGIGVGHEVGQDGPQWIPLLSAGSTITVSGDWSAQTWAGTVGYTDGYTYHAGAALGYGPARLGIVVNDDNDGAISSYAGFEAPLSGPGRITCRAIGMESDAPLTTMGLTLVL